MKCEHCFDMTEIHLLRSIVLYRVGENRIESAAHKPADTDLLGICVFYKFQIIFLTPKMVKIYKYFFINRTGGPCSFWTISQKCQITCANPDYMPLEAKFSQFLSWKSAFFANLAMKSIFWGTFGIFL